MKAILLSLLVGYAPLALSATFQATAQTPQDLTIKTSTQDEVGRDDKGIIEDAKKGDVGAEFFMGFDNLRHNKPAEALPWLRKAAAKNHPRAQFYLGYMYVEGKGVKKNTKEGMQWIEKSAKLGSHEGQYAMALAYVNGENGFAKDNTKAYAWMSLSADQDYEPAEKDLKKMKKLFSDQEIDAGKKLAKELKTN